MCQLLSGWINLKTEAIEIADLKSHSKTQELMKWSSADLQHRREWEWTADDDGRSLVVRTHAADEHDASWWKAIILERWPTRTDALRDCIMMVAKAGGAIVLDNVTLPDGRRVNRDGNRLTAVDDSLVETP